MLKQVLAHLDFSVWAEVSFTIFVITFLAVVIRTLRSNTTTAHNNAMLVLRDGSEEMQDV